MDLKRWIQQWLLLMLGVFLAAQLVGGIQYESNGAVIAVVLILSVLNVLLRPLLILLTLPFVIFTFGFGILLINALLFLMAGEVVPGFHVHGFWAAFWGSVIVSLTGFIANLLLGKSSVNVEQHRKPGPGKKSSDDDVIDI